MAAILLLWTCQTTAVAVSTSGNANRIKELAENSKPPVLLYPHEVGEITNVGKLFIFDFMCVNHSSYHLGFTIVPE